jgi:hypothetical protein
MKRKRQEQTQAADEAAGGQSTGTIETENSQVAGREPGDERIYPPTANPFEIASNNGANVRLFEHRGSGRDDPYYRFIAFPDGKPSDKVRQFMKDKGVQWNKPVGSKTWNIIIDYPTRNQDRLHAERVFAEVINLILEEKGLAREPEQERF